MFSIYASDISCNRARVRIRGCITLQKALWRPPVWAHAAHGLPSSRRGATNLVSAFYRLIYLSLTYLCLLFYSLTQSYLLIYLFTYLLTQDLENEQLERGADSVSEDDEEANLQPHCLQGYGGSSGSESDLPEPTGGAVSGGWAADFE